MNKVHASFAALLIAGMFGATTDLEAKFCKNKQVVGIAMKKYKNQAKLAARIDWRKKVKRRFGSAYSSWSIAYVKSQHCRRIGTRYKCLAKANPCKP